MAKVFKVYRCGKTGRFVTAKYAKEHRGATVAETRIWRTVRI